MTRSKSRRKKSLKATVGASATIVGRSRPGSGKPLAQRVQPVCAQDLAQRPRPGPAVAMELPRIREGTAARPKVLRPRADQRR
jgi:hypothetical protein